MKSDQIVKFTFLALDEAMSTHVSAAFIQNTPTVRATLRVQNSDLFISKNGERKIHAYLMQKAESYM